LELPLLTVGGAIGACTSKKVQGSGISYVRCERSDYLLEMTITESV